MIYLYISYCSIYHLGVTNEYEPLVNQMLTHNFSLAPSHHFPFLLLFCFNEKHENYYGFLKIGVKSRELGFWGPT